MNPLHWGPSMWNVIHSVAARYPVTVTYEERKAYLNFFTSLCYIIPCDSCKFHYSVYVRKHNIDLRNRQSLMIWTFHLHNDVNERLGKIKFEKEAFISKYINSWREIKKNTTCVTCNRLK
jgi:mitochondrial FAD-linked sulfhydryl oxidase